MIDFACDSELKYHKKIDMVKTPWFDVKEWNDKSRKHEVRSYLYSRLKTDLKPTDITKKTDLLEKHPSIWSAIYRIDFLKENKIKFPKIAGSGWADNPFMIETLVSAKSIIYLNKPYYHYRCDLPGTTHNHKKKEQIALPFDRWCDMTKLLRKKGVKDAGVWKAHYKRGLDYVHGAIIDDGWNNEVVQNKTKQVFDMMDPKIVFSLETFYPQVKKLYAEIEGLDVSVPKFSKKQMSFYAKETALFLKGRGIKDTASLAVRQLKGLVK